MSSSDTVKTRFSSHSNPNVLPIRNYSSLCLCPQPGFDRARGEFDVCCYAESHTRVLQNKAYTQLTAHCLYPQWILSKQFITRDNKASCETAGHTNLHTVRLYAVRKAMENHIAVVRFFWCVTSCLLCPMTP